MSELNQLGRDQIQPSSAFGFHQDLSGLEDALIHIREGHLVYSVYQFNANLFGTLTDTPEIMK